MELVFFVIFAVWMTGVVIGWFLRKLFGRR
jgi:hypothetical protein